MPEIIDPIRRARPPRIVVVDFDGTLTLIRSGWIEIRVNRMVTGLRPLPGTNESDEELLAFITSFLLEMTGRATIFQMEHFLDTAKNLGADPNSPDFYTQRFIDT